MNKYINEDKLLKAIASECDYQVPSCNDCKNKCELYQIIYYQEDIIRCKECKHYHKGFGCDLMQRPIEKDLNWFCADGEKCISQ